MPDRNGLVPIRVDVTPGRKVVHVQTFPRLGGATVEVRTPYRVVGVAWDAITKNERVVLAAADGEDAGGLYLFSFAALAEYFVDLDPPWPAAETVVAAVPERVAGHVSESSGV